MRSTAEYTKLQKALEDDLKKISNLLMHERYSNTLKQMTVIILMSLTSHGLTHYCLYYSRDTHTSPNRNPHHTVNTEVQDPQSQIRIVILQGTLTRRQTFRQPEN